MLAPGVNTWNIDNLLVTVGTKLLHDLKHLIPLVLMVPWYTKLMQGFKYQKWDGKALNAINPKACQGTFVLWFRA